MKMFYNLTPFLGSSMVNFEAKYFTTRNLFKFQTTEVVIEGSPSQDPTSEVSADEVAAMNYRPRPAILTKESDRFVCRLDNNFSVFMKHKLNPRFNLWRLIRFLQISSV